MSINMARRNVAMHSLLNMTTKYHLILVQEPWFSRIGTARADGNPDGESILGGVASPGWEAFHPVLARGATAKVMIYKRKTATFFNVVARPDLAAHNCLQIVDVITDDQTLRIVNFYNDIRDSSARQALFQLDLQEPHVPTVVCGDFNTHSPSWSLPGATQSSWARDLEDWAATQLLQLANPELQPTRFAKRPARDSVIDLAWYNDAAVFNNTCSPLTIDRAAGLGSDHAALLFALSVDALPPPVENTERGFVIDPARKEGWTAHLRTHASAPLPMSDPPTAQECDAEAAAITTDFALANEAVFDRRKSRQPQGSPWWDAVCEDAAQAVHAAHTGEAKDIASAALRTAVRKAKRSWADDIIRSGNLWEAAKWRHGRRVTKIPSVRNEEGLVHTHEDMAHIFRDRFFASRPPEVQLDMEDDPPPAPERDFYLLTEEEIGALLLKTDNNSAPGPSGQGWRLLKWAWSDVPGQSKRVTRLFNACVTAGHHPKEWREATIAVIPKPGRADYSLPKNYRPIALLECLGKLLEKTLARRIYFDLNTHNLVPTNQFGARDSSSTLDAGLVLLHDAQLALAQRLRCGALLFDVKGFFDNINHGRLVRIFEKLGFPGPMVRWLRSFLTDRRIRLRFNGLSAEPLSLMVGTPQGSPISPVLSIIYTSPLLHIMRQWSGAALSMYVDDGIIFAASDSWSQTADRLREGYRECVTWLTQAGLSAEPDKTELIFFRRRRERDTGPQHLHLFNPAISSYYRVAAAQNIRYLGFFFSADLTWDRHVKIMCNRARASLKSLQILGNSVRGLDFASWRLAYNAVCLPVLTYGLALWAHKGLEKHFKQVELVQNQAVCHISGSFRTAPREPLHQILAILPIKTRANMLLLNVALRYCRLPRESQVLKRLEPMWQGWTSVTELDLPLPVPVSWRRNFDTTLTGLARKHIPESVLRVKPHAIPPWGLPKWGNRLTLDAATCKGDARSILNQEIQDLTKMGSNLIVFATDGTGTQGNGNNATQWYATAAVAYQHGVEVRHGERLIGTEAAGNLLTARAIESAAITAQLFLVDCQAKNLPTPDHLIILTNNAGAINRLSNFGPHPTQPVSIAFRNLADQMLQVFPRLKISVRWAPAKCQPPGFKRGRTLAQNFATTPPPPNFVDTSSIDAVRTKSRQLAIAAWSEKWHATERTSHAYTEVLRGPPDGRLSHGLRAIAKAKPNKKPAREAESTLFRFLTGHAFTGKYAQRFHAVRNIPTACECGLDPQTVNHVVFDCPRYAAARAVNPRFDFDDRTGRPIKRLSGILRSATRTNALLKFLDTTRACFRPRPTREPD